LSDANFFKVVAINPKCQEIGVMALLEKPRLPTLWQKINTSFAFLLGYPSFNN